MTFNKKSIYDADCTDELKDYTLALLEYLEKQKKLAPGTVDHMFRTCVDAEGNLTLFRRCKAKTQKGRLRHACLHNAEFGSCYCEQHRHLDDKCDIKPRQVELEYFVHNGKPFYIQFESKDVYSYGSEPKLIGKYDFDSDAIIACVNL